MGWYLYREHFPWGRTDGYTDGHGHFWFVECVNGRQRYYTPQRLARRLERLWRPQETVSWTINISERAINELKTMM